MEKAPWKNRTRIAVRPNTSKKANIPLRDAMLLFYLFTFSVLLWHRISAMSADTTEAERAHDGEIIARIVASMVIALIALVTSWLLARRKRRSQEKVATTEA